MGSTAKSIDVENYALIKVEDALDFLESSICCEERLFPPVYQCKNGHAICSICKNTIGSSCPTCRSSLIEIRSLPFEKLFHALRFTCKFYTFGCFELLPYNSKLQHEQNCGFMPFDCPYPRSNCKVSLDVRKIVIHMKNFHRCKVVDHPIEYEFSYSKPPVQDDAKWDLVICSHLGEHFCLYIKSSQEHGSPSFFTHLMFIGDSVRAGEFCYHVQVSNGKQKKSHEGAPCSIRACHSSVEDREDGLVINSKAAQLLSTDGPANFKFWVTCKIWKE